jgi:hypothetical protein
MKLDSVTKSFLLHVLNEQAPMGGGVNLNPMVKDKKSKNKFDADYYFGQDELKKALETTSGKEAEEFNQSSPSLEYLSTLGMIKRGSGYSTDPDAPVELLTPAAPLDKSGNWNVKGIGQQLLGVGTKTGAAAAALNLGMGELGAKLSTKLPYLVALGIDPFDYATKVMGVDYVADQLRKLPARQKQQITSGAGYINL